MFSFRRSSPHHILGEMTLSFLTDVVKQKKDFEINF